MKFLDKDEILIIVLIWLLWVSGLCDWLTALALLGWYWIGRVHEAIKRKRKG